MQITLRGYSTGKILVYRDAQKTNAYQSNKNILLGDKSTINTKPQLEIYADDVRCTHGTTTGMLNEEALFYMRSRGLNEKLAKNILLQAFAKEVSNTIKNEAFPRTDRAKNRGEYPIIFTMNIPQKK